MLTIYFQFQDPKKISAGTKPDILEMYLIQEIQYETQYKIVKFSKGLKSVKSIPPLVEDSKYQYLNKNRNENDCWDS